MARIELDIDLDEFSHDEILRHLSYELKHLDEERGWALRTKLLGLMNGSGPYAPKNITLYDSMKIQLLTENLDKIKLEDLELIIKNNK